MSACQPNEHSVHIIITDGEKKKNINPTHFLTIVFKFYLSKLNFRAASKIEHCEWLKNGERNYDNGRYNTRKYFFISNSINFL